MAVTPPICDFGWKAPGFTLPATDGVHYSLDDIRGPNGTLIMFICNHCPYVQAILDRIVRDAAQLQEAGIGVAAISANDVADYPEDSFENMGKIAKDHGFSFPYLYDESQEVAKAFGAVCTPDFFGFDARDGLQYRGRLDASMRQAGPSDAKRELYEAMIGVARTGAGPREQIASMGCSIKWKSA
ncbi:alkyl hydroperoxide reductase [Thioclava dalianensis]|uniref:Alkyl hydroperoxide reductase n=1 Tax=Thioclava dalianensis TaxID=1185766 RepID=A0A074TRB8_9RHOB|nr:thioredoxin family protein [Thioclava dalianensis]KEP71518.1 alkyl hydroperoxide reductase [Thioclava dalianensis]SFN45656.1 AhpC/TSA family protein [Thioclava dalianensis]